MAARTRPPELNAIERVWRDLEAHHLAHQTFADAKALDSAIQNAVEASSGERTRHPLDSHRIPA